MWFITLILIILAGMFNAAMDVLRYRYKTSIFKDWKYQNWVNPALSQMNKWKPTTKFGDLMMSTVLVWVTDMWHFVKMLMWTSIMFGIIFYNPITSFWLLDVFILYFSLTGTFELFFSVIFIKK